ncbi:MAG: DUF4175 family protein [Alphaproteobacteria bacterium]|nr:DUF4175 family protein [Alphaproteobacteria bacterium]
MTDDPQDFETTALHDRIRRLRIAGGAVLFAERLTAALWRPFAWSLFFSGLWMLQIPAIGGQAGEIAVLLIFAGGLATFLYKDARSFRFPSAHEIDRRLETGSALAHRPLSAGLSDRLANPEKHETRALWEKRRAALYQALYQITLPRLRAFLAQKDPYALRMAALMLFIFGLAMAGPDAGRRIWNGLTPASFAASKDIRHNGLLIQITPPDYTGLAQIVPDSAAHDIPDIPAGSRLKILVQGGFGTPILSAGDARYRFTPGDKGAYALDIPIPENANSLKLSQSFIPRGTWSYTVRPDTPPEMTLTGEPETLENGQIRFPLSFRDDYGVRTLRMHMALDKTAQEATNAPRGQEMAQERSILSPPGELFETAPVYDLTAHPWAGFPVIFRLEADDHAGQSTSLPPLHMSLPERNFTHPVARQIIAVRKSLFRSPEASYEQAYLVLLKALSAPAAFENDPVTYLALRVAMARMTYNKPSIEISESLAALLWDTALRIEDGGLTLAARKLRDAQNALEQALQDPNLSAAEKSRLMNNLRQAMAEYLMAMQMELRKQIAREGGMPPSSIPPEMLAHMLNPDMLANFLDQMEAQLLSGDKQSAQDLLSKLQRLTDMMTPSSNAGSMPEDMQMMMKGVSALQELIDKQKALLAQTRKQADLIDKLDGLGMGYGERLPPDKQVFEEWGLEDMPPAPTTPSLSPQGEREAETVGKIPFINTKPNETEQEALRLVLGRLMLEADEKLNEIPEELGLAELEMRASARKLGENRPDLSVPHQGQAIAYLEKSQEQLARQFADRMQQMTGMAFGMGGLGTDPLGRPYGGRDGPNGLAGGSRVKIPDEAQKSRAQEILRLLRRRASELNRPEEELEYYRRLLRQF